MHNPTPDPKQQQPAYANQTGGYEKRDVVLPTISIWVIFLFLFVIGSSVIAYGMYIFLSPRSPFDPAAVARTSTEPQEPPAPQLQEKPVTEMRDFRALEQATVNGYGKYRGSEERYRIPVDRAVELTAERGFPKTETMSKADAAIPNLNRGAVNMRQGDSQENVDNQNAPVR
jgi:hypothetical protein